MKSQITPSASAPNSDICIKSSMPDRKTGNIEQTGHGGKNLKIRAALLLPAVIALLLSIIFNAIACSNNFLGATTSNTHNAAPDTPPLLSEAPEPTCLSPEPTLSSLERIDISDMEGKANVKHIRLDGLNDFHRGVIKIIEDDGGCTFYALKGDKLIELENHETSLTYVWNDMSYDVRFIWCEVNGAVYTHAHDNRVNSEAYWYACFLEGRSDVVLLVFTQGRQVDYRQYSVILNLKTKEITEVFADVDVSQSGHVVGTDFTSDLSKALITCEAYDEIYSYYYYNMKANTVTNVNSFVPGDVISARFIDDDAMLCFEHPQEDRLSGYCVSMSSGKYAAVFSDCPAFYLSGYGLIPSYSRYGVYVEENGDTYVIDYKSGKRRIIKGFVYSGDDLSVEVNDDETKILLAEYEHELEDYYVTKFGVYDLKKRTFTLLDSGEQEHLRKVSMTWFDNSRGALWSRSEDFSHVNLYLYDTD